MRKRNQAPLKLTREEKEKLGKFLWLHDWHFDVLVKRNCTEISSHYIYWDSGGKLACAAIFGLPAIKVETKEPCIANVFIRFRNRLYQFSCITEACKMLELLKKEHEYEEYEKKLFNQKWEERQKVAERLKKGSKVKNIKSVRQKDAA